MSRFVVLLRGVNVGKGNKVSMAQFRAALEDLGHEDVRTLLNSGNAVFSSTSRSAARLASAIADVVEERFGVATPVIVKSARDLEAIVEDAPFAPPESDRARFVVAFAMDTRALRELDSPRVLGRTGRALCRHKTCRVSSLPWRASEKQGGEGPSGPGGLQRHHAKLGHGPQAFVPRRGQCSLSPGVARTSRRHHDSQAHGQRWHRGGRPRCRCRVLHRTGPRPGRTRPGRR
ncbi:MAG: DUF1697 domain-containing protein [Betaproteobacteria bacterium]|nr:DUF1697 domain-containing protein [Betaproteobacteria bacterium]